jgi:CBS domain-containing protein
MLTDRDITVRATAEGLDPKTTSVQEAMSPEVVHAYEDEDIDDAVPEDVRPPAAPVIVLDRNRKLAGIVSIGDWRVDSHDAKLTGKTLEKISFPGRNPH